MERVKIRCPFCDFETDNIHTFFGHCISTHCDDQGFFVLSKPKRKKEFFLCEFCGKKFKSEDKMFRHLIEKHSKELVKSGAFTEEEIKEIKKQLGVEEEKSPE